MVAGVHAAPGACLRVPRPRAPAVQRRVKQLKPLLAYVSQSCIVVIPWMTLSDDAEKLAGIVRQQQQAAAQPTPSKRAAPAQVSAAAGAAERGWPEMSSHGLPGAGRVVRRLVRVLETAHQLHPRQQVRACDTNQEARVDVPMTKKPVLIVGCQSRELRRRLYDAECGQLS